MDRFGVFTLCMIGLCARMPSVRQSRVQLDGPGGVGQRTIHLTHSEIRVGSICVELGVIWVQNHCLIVIPHRTAVITSQIMNPSTLVPQSRAGWVPVDRLISRFETPLQVTLPVVRRRLS